MYNRNLWKKLKVGLVMCGCAFVLWGCGAAGEMASTDANALATETTTTDSSSSSAETTTNATQSSDTEGQVSNSTLEADTNTLNSETNLAASESIEPEPSELSLLMVGDILLHTPVAESGLQEDGSYDFASLFTNTSDVINEADIALVNQEVIIGGEELGISGYPCFNAPYALGVDLVDAGFDVICHATNHALDKGKKGLLNCAEFWQTNYPEIEVLGIHESQESQDTILYIEQNDITVAILNYTYGTNGIALPGDMPYAVDMLENEAVLADIQEAEIKADFTIVCPHWGTEYQLSPSAYQEDWTQIFLENGVDLVLGTHPHVIEPIEMFTNEDTSEEMLVYYSLGNFVNWTSSSGEGIANRMVGGMATVTLEKTSDGEVAIADYGVKAVVCHVSEGTGGVSAYLLSEYPSELASTNAIIAQDANFSREYCVDLCNKVWGDAWE